MLDDSDFYPYGGERVVSSGSGNHYKFEGKEWDLESGLDDFGARFYVSRYGRFMTPDWAEKATAVPYSAFGNPQTLNLYAFVHDNPESYADVDGHQCQGVEGVGPGDTCPDPGDPRDNPSYLDAKKVAPTVTVTYVSGDNPLPGSNTPTAASGGSVTFDVNLSPALPKGDGTVQANLQFDDGRQAKGEVGFTSDETQVVRSALNPGTPGERTSSTFTATIIPFEPKNDLGGSGTGKIVFTVTASDGTVAKGSAKVTISTPSLKIPLVDRNTKQEVKSSPFRTATMILHAD